MSVQLTQSAGGILLRVKASPGARRNEIRGVRDGALKFSVTQIAERGKANRAIAALLARSLGLRKSQLQLVAGPTSAEKTFCAHGISLAELAGRIQAALPQSGS